MTNPYQTTGSGEPPKKKGKGCLIAAIIAAILAIMVVIAGIWGFGKMKERVSTDPAKVTAMADSIVQVETGADWKPEMSMDLFVMRMAIFTADQENAVLIVMDGNPATLGSGAEFENKMRSEITKQNAKRAGGKGEPTNEVSSSREDFMVRGEPVSFLVSQKEGVDSKTPYLEISGAFDSNKPGHTAFIYLSAPESAMTMAQAKALIESAK